MDELYVSNVNKIIIIDIVELIVVEKNIKEIKNIKVVLRS